MKKQTEEMAVRPEAGAATRTDTARRVAPPVDIYETAESYVLRVDLPGAAKDTVGLTLENGLLTLHATAAPYHEAGTRLVFRELVTPEYVRSFTIGDGVDQSAVDAHLEDGVLTVKLHKKAERKPREIAIR